VPALAAAALALFLLFPGLDGERRVDAPPGATERAKGGPQLVVYRFDGVTAERLEDGALVRQGDLIQLGYVAAGAQHGVILSVDGRGDVTLHYPTSQGGPTALRSDGLRRLGRSYELDDAPDFERFFFVTADAPLDAAGIAKAVQAYVAGKATRVDVSGVREVAEVELAKE